MVAYIQLEVDFEGGGIFNSLFSNDRYRSVSFIIPASETRPFVPQCTYYINSQFAFTTAKSTTLNVPL